MVTVNVVRSRVAFTQERLQSHKALDDVHASRRLVFAEADWERFGGVVRIDEANLEHVLRLLLLDDCLHVPIVLDELALHIVEVEQVRTVLNDLKNLLLLFSFLSMRSLLELAQLLDYGVVVPVLVLEHDGDRLDVHILELLQHLEHKLVLSLSLFSLLLLLLHLDA